MKKLLLKATSVSSPCLTLQGFMPDALPDKENSGLCLELSKQPFSRQASVWHWRTEDVQRLNCLD